MSTVRFPSGSQPGDIACFRARVLADGTVEGEEVVTLTMESSDALVSGDIQFTIQDSSSDLQGKERLKDVSRPPGYMHTPLQMLL